MFRLWPTFTTTTERLVQLDKDFQNAYLGGDMWRLVGQSMFNHSDNGVYNMVVLILYSNTPLCFGRYL